jgi:hypothetical protein
MVVLSAIGASDGPMMGCSCLDLLTCGGAVIARVRPGGPIWQAWGPHGSIGKWLLHVPHRPGSDGWLCYDDRHHVAHISLPRRPFPKAVWRFSEPPSSSLDGEWRRGGLLVRIEE